MEDEPPRWVLTLVLAAVFGPFLVSFLYMVFIHPWAGDVLDPFVIPATSVAGTGCLACAMRQVLPSAIGVVIASLLYLFLAWHSLFVWIVSLSCVLYETCL